MRTVCRSDHFTHLKYPDKERSKMIKHLCKQIPRQSNIRRQIRHRQSISQIKRSSHLHQLFSLNSRFASTETPSSMWMNVQTRILNPENGTHRSNHTFFSHLTPPIIPSVNIQTAAKHPTNHPTPCPATSTRCLRSLIFLSESKIEGEVDLLVSLIPVWLVGIVDDCGICDEGGEFIFH